MNINDTLQNYFNELSSNSPTPGGGNVSALCAVLSSSLGEMVCNLTIGKKKYADVEQEMVQIKEKLIAYKQTFIGLAIEDNKAFDKVMDAFRLPKENDKEKELRAQKIDEATLYAAEVPAKLIKTCNEVIPLIELVVLKGNQNSLSDAGVAALLLSTAAQGAYLNVLINCSSLNDKLTANKVLDDSKGFLDITIKLSNEILVVINKRLSF